MWVNGRSVGRTHLGKKQCGDPVLVRSLQLESTVMPYLAVLSDFREDVRKIAREQKGEAETRRSRSRPSFRNWLCSPDPSSDGAAAALRRRPGRHAAGAGRPAGGPRRWRSFLKTGPTGSQQRLGSNWESVSGQPTVVKLVDKETLLREREEKKKVRHQ